MCPTKLYLHDHVLIAVLEGCNLSMSPVRQIYLCIQRNVIGINLVSLSCLMSVKTGDYCNAGIGLVYL